MRLREEWRLSRSDAEALLGASEESLVALARDGGALLAVRIEERVRTLDEIASLACVLLAGLDAAEWLRAPCRGLRGRTPLEVMAGEPGGARHVLCCLRAEYLEARR